MAKDLTKSDDYGPAMSALNEQQQRFVTALLTIPRCSFTQAAREAGYSDKSGGCKVRALAPRYQLVRRLAGIPTLA
jgi:hypothetical protein